MEYNKGTRLSKITKTFFKYLYAQFQSSGIVLELSSRVTYMKRGPNQTSDLSQPDILKLAFQIKHFPIGSFQSSTSLSIMLALIIYCFPVNLYMYIVFLTLDSKFLELLLTGCKNETKTLGRHFEYIFISWLFSDAEWSQDTSLYSLPWYH